MRICPVSRSMIWFDFRIEDAHCRERTLATIQPSTTSDERRYVIGLDDGWAGLAAAPHAASPATDRCTFFAICAQEPTVAQGVSTIVPSPT